MLMCTASSTSSPWHNFVSDEVNWVDETNETPCANTSGGFLASDVPFVQNMLTAGAKKIWAARKEVTLTGTPPV